MLNDPAADAFDVLVKKRRAPGVRALRTASFGSPVLETLYQEVRRAMKRRHLEWVSFDPADRSAQWASLIVAGMWRVDRQISTGLIKLEQWNEPQGQWKPVQEWSQFPSFRLVPLKSEKSALTFAHAALGVLLNQMGWESPEHWETMFRENAVKMGYAWPNLDVPLADRLQHLKATVQQFNALNNRYQESDQPVWWKKPGHEVFAEKVKHEYRIKKAHEFLRQEIKTLMMGSTPLEQHAPAAAQGLVKRLWSQAVDREVLGRVGLARMRQPIYWTDYVRYAQHAPALRRVATEHRNLVPMLERIEPKYWSRPNLFSRRRWVRDGRKEMVIETRTFCRPLTDDSIGFVRRQPTFVAFEQPAAFRWMLKASPLVIHRWLATHDGDGAVLERCVRLNLPPTTSPLIWEALLRVDSNTLPQKGREARWYVGLPNPLNHPNEHQEGLKTARAALDRAFRLYALHLLERWRTIGMHAMLAYTATAPFLHLLDWLRVDGCVRGLPDKNANWESMKRMSEAWHERRNIEAQVEQQPLQYTWFCPWGEPEVIDGVRVTPLTTSTLLWDEGGLMEHCVGWNGYDKLCYDGHGYIFSLIDTTVVSKAKGPRSTLCLTRNRSQVWSVQQNSSYHNHPVNETLRQVGQKVALLVNERETAFRASGQPRPLPTCVKTSIG